MLPIILLLGPAGCGKGTLAARLIANFPLFHFSVGDWLRSQIKHIHTSDSRINEFVVLDFPIPILWLTALYGKDWESHAPPALVLYVCSKLNRSTPSSMWIRSMDALKQECESVSRRGGVSYSAILLDNFPKLLSQSRALDRCFGESDLPILAISLACPSDVNLQRFLARCRGNDDEKTFRRRLQRFDKESPAVISKYKDNGKLVEVSALGTPEEVFEKTVSELEKESAWSRIFGDNHTEPRQPFAVTK